MPILTQKQRSRNRRAGSSFIEVMFSAVLVAVLMTAALNASGQAVLAQRMTANRATSQFLAQALLAEILQKRYVELGSSDPPLGVDSNEDLNSRASLDDADDYHGYSESPPRLPDGTDIPEYSGWTRSVEVTCVDPVTLAPKPSINTGAKRILVTVTRNGAPVHTALGIRTSAP